MSDVIAQHRKAGRLIIQLQRYALLGWLLFFASTGVFVLYILLDKFMPVPIIAVDESGRVLGKFDYMSASARTDGELLGAARYFAQRYFTLNSASIYDEYAEALSMMAAELRERKIAEVTELGYLTQISTSRTASYLKFGEGSNAPRVLWRDGDRAGVRLSGLIIVNNNTELPFDVTLTLASVPRSRLGTAGIVVLDIEDN